MIIKAIAENTSVNDALGCEHGLSLYIETLSHKILFDTGVSELFAKNALLLDVDLREADIAFISHGHYDHGGGLKTFLQINNRAKVYISSRAFDKHYANFESGGIKYIGLSEELLPSDRFVYVGNSLIIDEELALFSAVKCVKLNPTGNADLLMQNDKADPLAPDGKADPLTLDGLGYVCDDFAHEQNLVIRENGKTTLISGCSHCGIVNILEHFYRLHGCYPDTVIGGFHLYNPAKDTHERPELVNEIAEFLIQTKARFYTCHCTGIESYKRLKDIIGDRIDYLSGGMTITI